MFVIWFVYFGWTEPLKYPCHCVGLGKLDNPALMQQWFHLVQQKNSLVRYESELMILWVSSLKSSSCRSVRTDRVWVLCCVSVLESWSWRTDRVACSKSSESGWLSTVTSHGFWLKIIISVIRTKTDQEYFHVMRWCWHKNLKYIAWMFHQILKLFHIQYIKY